jgi:DNA repair ATPase RecN
MKQRKQLSVGSYQLSIFFCLVFVYFCLPSIVSAQDEIPPDVAAVPDKTFTEVEKKALEIKDVKKRTKLSIEFMETRLRTAEMLVQEPKFQDALKEIGIYQGLLEDSFDFLEQNDLKSDKVQDNFRSLELVLRKHITRLELIRREMSYKYGWHVQKLMKFVREIRAKAVEPLFSDSVVPNNKPR